MQKLLQLLVKYVLPALLLFFIVFIPLFPKLPLLDIFGTWVYIRLEDFLVALTVGFLGIAVATKKIPIKTPLTVPIAAYWIAALLSTIIAVVFLFPHINNVFPHIAFLHYFRRIEYMILFFLAFAVVSRNKKILPILVTVLVCTGFAIVVYGIGQKYAGWPAFSTMNEEFAKGVPLRLPPTARIMSTFAGHYDLAAYLVLTIPIFGSILFGVKKIWMKLLLFIASFSSFILLLLTASRVSFGVYLATISLMLWWQKKRWLIVPVVIVSIISVQFVSGASERFLKTLRFNDVVVDLSTGKPIGTLERVEGGKAVLERISEPDEENLPKGSGFIGVPTAPVPTKGAEIEQVQYIKKKDLVAGKADVATVSGSFLIQRAFVLDISITTRFQGQWPRAIAAFKRNVVTGSGFSTLSLAADGNYHRMLGETGVIGTVLFLGIFLYAFVWFWKKKDELDPLERSFVVGLFAGIAGLGLNAILIDVFEASKVAFPLWMLLGAAVALLAKHKLNLSYWSFLYRFFTHKYALLAYFSGSMFFIFGGIIGSYFIGDDFTWLKWAAESQLSQQLSSFIDAKGFFYRPVPKLWYFGLFSFFWLMPQAYHIASIVLYIGICILVFLLLRQMKIKTIHAGVMTLVFSLFSIHHENVFWISGQSSLLAVFFFLLSLELFFLSWKTKTRHHIWLTLSAAVSLILSLCSWETLIVGPVIAAVLGFVYAKKKHMFSLLLIIPLYAAVRSFSGAVPPSGDYGYNMSRFLVNAVGNGLTYTLAVLFGPKIIEMSVQIREYFRMYSTALSAAGVLFSAIGAAVLYRYRNVLSTYKTGITLFLCYVISLVPFLGLGAASERYGLLPSVFFIFCIAFLVQSLWESRYSLFIKLIPFLLLLCISIWNYREIGRLLLEWKFAGTVTEQTLKSIRTGFFPPATPPAFVFIDTPIRLGRAWMFPTGLQDALWHMYRQTPYTTTHVQSIEAAFAYPNPKDTDKIILQFTDYKLQQVVKESVQ